MKWLVLAYFTGVDGMAGSLHMDRMVDDLRTRGHQVKVITSPVGEPDGKSRRVFSALPSGLRFEIRHLARRSRNGWMRRVVKPVLSLLLAPFYILEKIIFPAEPAWSWSIPAARAGLRAAREFEPDVIFSTCGPYSAHVAAGKVAARYGIPWIAEYRDPLVHEGAARGRLEEFVLRRVERQVARDAAAVIYVVDRAREKAQERVDFSGRAVCIYTGAPPEETAGMAPAGGRLRLLHTGTLSKTRNLAPVVTALDLLKGSSPEILPELEFVQVGFANKNVAEQASSYPDNITIAGRVPHRELSSFIAGAHGFLLMQDDNDFSSETIPSKVYEYLHAGRPVLGVIRKNPELTAMLSELGHYPVELDNPQELADALSELHRLWKAGEIGTGIKPSPHTVKRAVDELLELTREIGLG
jgi:glycosyltransferase involved in cell wall biosynthesis